ncbi:MAG: hypothetical protein AB1452_08225 [Pseudomonadota bacterium]
MTNLVEAIGFSLMSLADFEDGELALRVLRRLKKTPTELQPLKFGIHEPLDQRINCSDLEPVLSVWPNSTANAREKGEPREAILLLEGSSGVGYMINWHKSKTPSFSAVDGHAPLGLLKNKRGILGEFFDLFKDLAVAVDAVYGDIRNMSLKGWDLPFDLVRRLPDVPWVSIYGPPYVSMFGRERILSAPFLKIEEIGSSHLWLQASESVFDSVAEETRAAIREHLGAEAFMSKGRWRYSDGKAPAFDFSRVLLP